MAGPAAGNFLRAAFCLVLVAQLIDSVRSLRVNRAAENDVDVPVVGKQRFQLNGVCWSGLSFRAKASRCACFSLAIAGG